MSFRRVSGRDIKDLLFEKEMQLIRHVFDIPLGTTQDPDERVYDFKDNMTPIQYANGKFMVVQNTSELC